MVHDGEFVAVAKKQLPTKVKSAMISVIMMDVPRTVARCSGHIRGTRDRVAALLDATAPRVKVAGGQVHDPRPVLGRCGPLATIAGGCRGRRPVQHAGHGVPRHLPGIPVGVRDRGRQHGRPIHRRPPIRETDLGVCPGGKSVRRYAGNVTWGQPLGCQDDPVEYSNEFRAAMSKLETMKCHVMGERNGNINSGEGSTSLWWSAEHVAADVSGAYELGEWGQDGDFATGEVV
ncbi:hypothetical protein ON010_g18755 [Phytophthora cinnamomi]|nr:hypothetical protein ON010_g18755 [Phytophthora cinnamomi]